MGGLFAAGEAARRGGVDALALWDPCLSGRGYLREQRFLRLLSTDDTKEADLDLGTAVEAPGIRFEPETVDELSTLVIEHMEGPLARRTLVLTPPGLSRPRVLEKCLADTAVDWQEATGQDLLLDSRCQIPPLETIERLATWLAGAVAAEPVSMISFASRPMEVGTTPTGTRIIEHTVRIGTIGLFGIITEGETKPNSPTIVLVDEGNTHHIGQARIWVDLARRLATAGLRVLRFDLSGNGDSGARPGQKEHVASAPEAIDDVLEAMRAVSPEDPSNVVLIGFCSGAYLIMERGLTAPPRGMCIVNPRVSFLPPEENGNSRQRLARQVSKPWLVNLVAPPLTWMASRRSGDQDRWIKALATGSWPVALATRSSAIPKSVWWFVNRYLLENTAIDSLEKLVGAGVNTLLVCGPLDLLPVSLGSEGRIERLQRSHRFRLALLEDLDHSAWIMEQRQLLIDSLFEHLVTTYGSLSSPQPLPSQRDRTP
jgi:alpha-beta hydrolase superfamily lysophospholipase